MTSNDREEAIKVAIVASAAAMFMATSIVGALAQRRLVDPSNVAEWAQFLGKNLPADMTADVRAGVASSLSSFADLLEDMKKTPPGAGHA